LISTSKRHTPGNRKLVDTTLCLLARHEARTVRLAHATPDDPRWGVNILVIGGTGPTGPLIVNGLVDRGHTVTILHTGNHEVDTIPAHLEHIHTDPFDGEAFRASIEGRNFDVVFAMYGRLRSIAEILVGRTPRLFSIGGMPAYRGFGEASTEFPEGMAIPARETGPLVADERSGIKPLRIAETEEIVMSLHPDATHFRYPYIYGPNQVLPREWTLVKRALDGRSRLIAPDGGLGLTTHSFVENATHAVLLAVDQIDSSAGQVYNVGDDVQLSFAGVAEIVGDELGHDWELTSVPGPLAEPAAPWVHNHSNTHRILSTERIRNDLGYRDLVDPEEGLRRTIRWQVEHLSRDATVAQRLQDPFDYAAEDQLLAASDRYAEAVAAIDYPVRPGWTFGYYGPHENPGGARGSFRA
jgi:nucleoside-diphosphate-sugar epimerase